MTARWALSLRDGHSHVVNDAAEHSDGGLEALCGHQVLTVTGVSDEPWGALCGLCVALRGLACTPHTSPRPSRS